MTLCSTIPAATTSRNAGNAYTRGAALILVMALAACSSITSTAPPPPSVTNHADAAIESLGGHPRDFTLFTNAKTNTQDAGSTGSGGGGLGVNAYLWRASLDTLSFMPLASADPFGGVIITDWYQPAAANAERFKATAYILGQQLRADGVKVAIFRQVMVDGQWSDAPVAPAMVNEIENKVLARARELRSQSASN